MRLIALIVAVFTMPHIVVAEALEGMKSSAEILSETMDEEWIQIDDDNLLIIELERGNVAVALSPVLAQSHVKQIRALAIAGFYDGLSFYRVIDGFVAQGGDVFGTRELTVGEAALDGAFEEAPGEGFAFTPLKDVDGFSPKSGFSAGLPTGYDDTRAWHLHCTGAIALGRENARNTASTEFYVALQPQRYLDRNLTVFGRVIEGMEHLQALRRVQPAQSADDDLGEKIVTMRIASAIPADVRPTFEYLDNMSKSFDAFVEARRNRPEEFFYYRPDHVDICQFPYPVRRKVDTSEE